MSATVNGFPQGFSFSEDPYGFIAQFWIGRRNAQNASATAKSAADVAAVGVDVRRLRGRARQGRVRLAVRRAGNDVQLTTNASDPDNDTLLYTWSVTGGKLQGEGKCG